MRIFSQEWASAYQIAINENTNYAGASKNWQEGALALVLNENDRGVLLDLLQGQCLSAKSISSSEAHASATYVIEGTQNDWRDVLNGSIQPLMAIMRGKLKLTKGSISRLLPYTKAASELVMSATTVPTEFE